MKSEDILLGILAIGLIGYIIISKKQEIKAQTQTSQPSQPKTETVSVSPFVSNPNIPTNVVIPTTTTQTTTVPITAIVPQGGPSTTISYTIEPANLPKDSVDDYITISFGPMWKKYAV